MFDNGISSIIPWQHILAVPIFNSSYVNLQQAVLLMAPLQSLPTRTTQQIQDKDSAPAFPATSHPASSQLGSSLWEFGEPGGGGGAGTA